MIATHPPLPNHARVVTHAGMNKQTLYIVGAIFGAVLLFFAYDRFTNPNLDGLTAYQRCDYHAYWQNHGGSVEQCRAAEADAAANRMIGDPDLRQAEADMNVTPAEVEPTQVPPTK
jgi:hypothetical protein